MTQPLSAIFNDLPADKVINLKEVRALSNTLYRQLSLSDRIYMEAIDKPLSRAAGLVFGVKVLTDAATQEQLKEVNTDGTVGMYQENDGISFMSVATLARMIDLVPTSKINPAYQARSNALTVQAIASAKDYKEEVTRGYLTPVKFS